MNVTKTQIKSAAEELNQVMQLSPAIDTSQNGEALIKQFREAVTLIEETDTYSDDTWTVINALKSAPAPAVEEAPAPVVDTCPYGHRLGIDAEVTDDCDTCMAQHPGNWRFCIEQKVEGHKVTSEMDLKN